MKGPRLVKFTRRRGVPALALIGAAALGFAAAYGTISPDRSVPEASGATRAQLVERVVKRSICDIKGNISARGERIYHVPGQEYYGRTRIDSGKGERYFCSEAEARAAGWRRSKV